jgi:hypothetical protein
MLQSDIHRTVSPDSIRTQLYISQIFAPEHLALGSFSVRLVQTLVMQETARRHRMQANIRIPTPCPQKHSAAGA